MLPRPTQVLELFPVIEKFDSFCWDCAIEPGWIVLILSRITSGFSGCSKIKDVLKSGFKVRAYIRRDGQWGFEVDWKDGLGDGPSQTAEGK